MAQTSTTWSQPSRDCVALRDAFAQASITPATASLLLATLDAGAGWEPATNAVAEGIAARFGHRARTPAPLKTKPRTSLWLPVLGGVALYIVLRPVLAVGHEVAVMLVALLAHAVVGTGWWQPAVTALGLDPIYTGTAIRAIGGVNVQGLAVAGPIGDWLHALMPALFEPARLVTAGAAVSMVAAPGTPALGRGIASFGADVAWLTIGLVVFFHWRKRSWPRALIGLLVQAQIAVHHLFAASVSLPDLEASGLPYAIALALPGSSRDAWFTTALTSMPYWAQDVIVGSALLVIAYAVAVGVLLSARGVRALPVHRLWRRTARPRARAAQPRSARLPVAAMGAAIAVAVAVSPIGALASARSNWQSNPRPLVAAGGESATGAHGAVLQAPDAAGPSVVQIAQTGPGQWQYVVNGQPTVIRGVGYNPQYAGLPQAQRQQVYQRDFGTMHHFGINTIEGWFETQFDAVTLDAAAQNGIGVIMPFELNQDWPYENPNVQQSILDHVSAYVEQYKDNPAVRMWAPGNENLHRVLYPHWVSKANDPVARARADAFAAFLPVLVDRIHELDPNHPVLYRDAEDVYLPRLKAAFAATGVQRPWLVYGANVYTRDRLQQITSQWPSQWFDGPLVISEFAPGGAGRADRPLGFQEEWAIIRRRPNVVLGGLAYTWATNGPEELDRVFGLVDPNGAPTDGALAALSAAYLHQP